MTRDEQIKKVCEAYISEHDDVRNFMAGFGKKTPCQCRICELARELLAGMEAAEKSWDRQVVYDYIAEGDD